MFQVPAICRPDWATIFTLLAINLLLLRPSVLEGCWITDHLTYFGYLFFSYGDSNFRFIETSIYLDDLLLSIL